MNVELNLVNAPHAPLLRRYSVEVRRHVNCGVPGPDGPIDPESGAAYTCLGEEGTGRRAGQIVYSTDSEVGHFYPAAIHVWGVDLETKAELNYEQIEALVLELLWTKGVQRMITPQGVVGGKNTWYRGVRVLPGASPPWYGLGERIAKKYGADALLGSYPNLLVVELSDVEFKDGRAIIPRVETTTKGTE